MNRRTKRLLGWVIALCILGFTALSAVPPEETGSDSNTARSGGVAALSVLDTLAVKGRAPKTGYERAAFGDGWATVRGCDVRNIILYRDLESVELRDACIVEAGILNDPYTNKTLAFNREDPNAVQIDHVVALSDAWQKGAQQLSPQSREQFANDPLNLLAVDGPANQQKSDADAATWLPPNKAFRCQYVARQIAVKQKYTLWVTSAEKAAMRSVLDGCPLQQIPTP